VVTVARARAAAQVVEENKRQLCVFQAAADRQEPWLWWAFAADYAAHCTMANGRFNDATCAREQAQAAGLDADAIEKCMGSSAADEEHPLLQARAPGGTPASAARTWAGMLSG
jgi:hypothetical protein